MIIVRTPYRVSLFGGSTDYPSYFKTYGSTLIGFAIDKYCTVTIDELPSFADCNFQAFYSKAERKQSIDEIENPGIRGTLKFLHNNFYTLNKLAIYIQNEIPAQTGMATSSAMIVGLLNAVHTMYGVKVSSRRLAKEAIYVERELLKEAGGWQDQIWCAYGGFNEIEINKNGEFSVYPMPMCDLVLEDLKKCSILFYTTQQRNSFAVAESHNLVSALEHKKEIHIISKRAKSYFQDGWFEDIGKLLDLSWQAKKSISSCISNLPIDKIFEIIKMSGGWGSKLLGSGTGGFIFTLCDNKDRAQIIENVGLPVVDYDFDFSGSQVIFQG